MWGELASHKRSLPQFSRLGIRCPAPVCVRVLCVVHVDLVCIVWFVSRSPLFLGVLVCYTYI